MGRTTLVVARTGRLAGRHGGPAAAPGRRFESWAGATKHGWSRARRRSADLRHDEVEGRTRLVPVLPVLPGRGSVTVAASESRASGRCHSHDRRRLRAGGTSTGSICCCLEVGGSCCSWPMHRRGCHRPMGSAEPGVRRCRVAWFRGDRGGGRVRGDGGGVPWAECERDGDGGASRVRGCVRSARAARRVVSIVVRLCLSTRLPRES